jgi:hypothetical protein
MSNDDGNAREREHPVCVRGQFIENQLNTYRGQPVSAAIAKFGNPTDQKLIDGEKVYLLVEHPLYRRPKLLLQNPRDPG